MRDIEVIGKDMERVVSVLTGNLIAILTLLGSGGVFY